MARFTVKHIEPIWETTPFEVELPDPLPDDYDDPVAYIEDHIDELMAQIPDGELTIEPGDRVESMDTEIHVFDANGDEIE